MPTGLSTLDPGFRPLLWTQALTALHHNQLRAAVLSMVAFGTINSGAWPVASVVGLVTILAVLPYVLFSLAAGRWADRWSHAGMVRLCKLAELPVAALAALGLLTGSLPLLLLTVLLCGIEAALLGPAKFAILPELVDAPRLVAANSWITATSTLAILLGLVLGNLLAAAALGPALLAGLGLALAGIGIGLSRAIPDRRRAASASPRLGWRDTISTMQQAGAQPRVVLAILGCSWFWFQGAFNTTAIPLLVAARDMGETQVSLLFIISSLCVALGALAARLLHGHVSASILVGAVALMTLLPGIDIGFVWAGPGFARLALDIAVMSLASGLFIVPVGLAMQVLPPPAERGLYIGINHLFNGLAMLLAGAGVAALGLLAIGPAAAIGGVGLLSAAMVLATLPLLLPTVRMATAKVAT